MSISIILPIYSKAITDQEFSLDGLNPGIGGTEFVTIMLAIYLSKSRSDYKIYLCNETPANISKQAANIEQINLPPEILFKERHFPSKETVVSGTPRL